MSNVTLTVGGRNYTVACAKGEEAHVQALGQMIDGKVRQMEGLASQTESRMLLFAALLLADELHEARSGAPAPAPNPAPAPAQQPAASALNDAALAALALRLENLAARLEGEAAVP